jgi:hypothetical protein
MMNRIRLAGAGAIAGGLLWSAAIVLERGFSYLKPGDGTGYYVVQAMAMLAFIGFLVGVQGLDWLKAAGTDRFGRWSLWAFKIGLVLLILAGMSILITRSDESPLFPLGGLIIAVAGVLTSVAVLRTGVLAGWQRFTPLLVSLYFVFGMVVPIIAGPVDGGAPTPLEFTWGVTWVIFGLAYFVPITRRAIAPGSTTELTQAHS